MTNREKVINKVKAIVADMQEEVDEWKDYSDSELRGGLTCDCDWWYKTLQTLKDALALLKAQEPVAVHVTAEINYRKIGNCPNCGKPINSGDYPNYCGHCGQAVKWE